MGRSRAPRSKWPPELSKQVQVVAGFFTKTLRPHFEIEERTLFPLVRQRLPDRKELIRTLSSEHDQVRSLIWDLERNPARNLEERLPMLGKLLEGHVRTEERVLFQAIQRELTTEEMASLGEQLLQLRRYQRTSSCQLPDATRIRAD